MVVAAGACALTFLTAVMLMAVVLCVGVMSVRCVIHDGTPLVFFLIPRTGQCYVVRKIDAVCAQ